MKKTVLIILAAIVCFSMLLCGCSKSGMEYAASYDSAAEPKADMNESPFNGGNAESGYPQPSDSSGVLPNRKIIRNAELTVEALDFDGFIASLNTKLSEYGGYVQSNYVDSSDYSKGRLRSASTVVRIPSDKLDAFLSDVNGFGNVIRRHEDLADVTDRYYDIEARLSSLRTEYDTLLGLLEKAENLDDIMKIQDRLTSVRYEIETCETGLRNYDDLIDYSTVSLSILEVEQETVVKEETFKEETSRRFNESLASVGRGFTVFAKWFIGNLPHIVVVLVFFGLIIFIVVFCLKLEKKNKAKKAAAMNPPAKPANTAAPSANAKNDGK